MQQNPTAVTIAHVIFLLLVIVSFIVYLSIATNLYSIISFNAFKLSLSALFIPIWFALNNIIAELYGQKKLNDLFLALILFQIIMLLVGAPIIAWTNIFNDYQFNDFLRAFIALQAAVLFSNLINIYLSNNLRSLLYVDGFSLKSSGVSMFSEILFVITIEIIAGYNLYTDGVLTEIIISSLFVLLLVSPLLYLFTTGIILILEKAGIKKKIYNFEKNSESLFEIIVKTTKKQNYRQNK